MASEFITRVEREKDEQYTVIFRTDDADKYKHIEDECRRMIGHEKPTVDAVPVVRCRECEHMKKKRFVYADGRIEYYKRCELDNRERPNEYFCADGERGTDGNTAENE